jgi:hypothetical protein
MILRHRRIVFVDGAGVIRVDLSERCANRPGDHLDHHRSRLLSRVSVGRQAFDEVARELREHHAGAQQLQDEGVDRIFGVETLITS